MHWIFWLVAYLCTGAALIGMICGLEDDTTADLIESPWPLLGLGLLWPFVGTTYVAFKFGKFIRS